MARLTHDDWAAIRAHPDTALGPPADAAALDAAERALGVRLPADHRALLLRGGNGGVLGSVRLFGVGSPDVLDLQRQVADNRPELERTAGGPVLPFASDWGGGYYCFDLRRRGGAGHDGGPADDYPVLYWDHEYSEEPADLPRLCSPVGDGFAAFVRRALR